MWDPIAQSSGGKFPTFLSVEQNFISDFPFVKFYRVPPWEDLQLLARDIKY